jgi:hypothetical protein
VFVKFQADNFDWISDQGMLGGEARFDLFGEDMEGKPVVLNVNVDNFDLIARSIAETDNPIFVEAPDEVLDLILARLPVV